MGPKNEKANNLGGLARHKLPLGSTQPPATQVTHARRGSAQCRSFMIFSFISDARGRLPGRPPNGGSRHLQLHNAARRARHCIRTMTHSPPVKPVPATVHGEGVWLQNYPISALRGVRPFFAPRWRCRMMRPREAMSAADTHLGPVPPSPMTSSASQILRSDRLCHHTRAVGSKGVTVDYCGPEPREPYG